MIAPILLQCITPRPGSSKAAELPAIAPVSNKSPGVEIGELVGERRRMRRVGACGAAKRGRRRCAGAGSSQRRMGNDIEMAAEDGSHDSGDVSSAWPERQATGIPAWDILVGSATSHSGGYVSPVICSGSCIRPGIHGHSIASYNLSAVSLFLMADSTNILYGHALVLLKVRVKLRG